jgi:tight adherence protein C
MIGLFTPVLLVVALVAVAAGLLVYGILILLAPAHGALHNRLVGAEEGASVSIFQAVLQGLVAKLEPVSRHLYGANKKYLTETKNLLITSGQAATDEVVWQLRAKQLAVGVLFGILGLGLGLFYSKMSHASGLNSLSIPFGGLVAGMLLGRYWPTMKLKKKAQQRQESIQRTLPDVLDLLVICVEAGLGLDAAILRVSKEVEPMAVEMAYELQRTHSELSAGIPRAEAFRHLGTRSNVGDLRSLCTLIIQSDKLGTSIADSLRVYSDEMRVRRRQRAEELAQKASIKMLFPLVLFVFPLLFLIIIGPAAIQIAETLLHMGQ